MLPPFDDTSRPPALEAFLIGQIAFDQALVLQQRIVEETRYRGDGQVTLLLCEHPPIVTVGRGGSPADVALHNHLLRSRQLETRWVNRGGGCLVHCLGQLAIYPIVPLRWHGFSVAEFLVRLQSGIVASLRELNVSATTQPHTALQRVSLNDRTAESTGTSSPLPLGEGQGVRAASHDAVYGRTGQLAAIGVAVRDWITYYGAYLNVCPPTGLFRLVRSNPTDAAPMSCLVAERCGPMKMTAVRAALIAQLADRLGCDRYHLYTGHPLLRRVS